MRRIERVRNLHGVIEQIFRGHRTALDNMPQRLPFEQLHHDEASPVLLVNVMNGANVGMIQRGSSARLALKALERLLVAGKFIGKEFQRDLPAEARVLSLIDDAHASAAELLQNPVVGNGLAVHGRHRAHGEGMLRPTVHPSQCTAGLL